MKQVMKKTLALLITIAMLASMITFITFDAVAEVTDTHFITSAADFAAMEPTGNYKLAADITVDTMYETTFTGTFDGDGHTITTSVTLFKKLERAVVKNLIIEGAINVTTASVAVGSVARNVTNMITLQNVKNYASVDSVYRAGGLIGQADTNSLLYMIGCENYGNVTLNTGSSYMTGGLLGYIQGNTLLMIDCVNEGKVSSPSGPAGGLVGRVGRDSANAAKYVFEIYNCINRGEVYAGKSSAAGIVAQATGCTLNILYSTNSGYIHGGDADTAQVAGICAYSNVMQVNSDGKSHYSSDLLIKRCLNEGKVENSKGRAGGFVAYWWGGGDAESHGNKIEVTACINSGAIIGGNSDGHVSQIVAYTNRDTNIIKDNLAIGSVAQKEGTTKYIPSFYSFSSAKIPSKMTGNKIVAGDGTTYYTYTASSGKEANIIKLEDLTASHGLKVITAAEVASAVAALGAVGYQAADTSAPTVITTAAEFKAINANPTGKFKLANDITITDADRVTEEFEGIFDGDGHTVTIENGTDGIFESVVGGKISNLTIKGSIVCTSDSNHVGALAGWANFWCEFTNITNYADVTSTGSSRYVGGLVGQMNQDSFGSPTVYIATRFTNCVNYGNVHCGSGSPRLGGIVGNSARYNFPIFENCLNYGNIDASPDPEKTVKGTIYLGGITSDVFEGLFINCYNAGNLTSTVSTDAGGICGRMIPSTQSADQSVSFKNCTNDGNLTVGSAHAGGIVGECGIELNKDGCAYACARAFFTIDKCVNNGNVTSVAGGNNAGIAGHGYGSGGSEYIRMYSCVNTGNVSAANADSWVSQFCAYINSASTVINNCVGMGTVSAPDDNRAVFIGLSNQDGTEYNLTDITMLENDGTKMFSYATSDSYSGHRIEFANRPDSITVKSMADCLNDVPADIGFIIDSDAKNVIDKIDAIGEVALNDTSKGKIDTARNAYDALDDAKKFYVSASEYQILTDAEALYAKLKADKEAADETLGLIEAIGEVALNATSKGKIDAARASYDALTADQKALITAEQLKVLTDAEAAYKALVDAAAAADAVADIDAIGEVALNDTSKGKIDAARASYDALTADQKALVTPAQLKVLTDAEALYAKLKADKEAADETLGLIEAIGEVALNDTSKGKIDAARASYDGLTADQKALITAEQLKVLTDAEALYAKLKDDSEKAAAALAKIEDIGAVEYTSDSKAKIDAARSAYDTLTADQKALITAEELKVLTDAEALYEKLKNDQTAANSATAKINSIGTVAYNATSKGKIDAARNAYDALTDDQKALISAAKLKTLTDAEAEYQRLWLIAEGEAAKAQLDREAAEAAVAKIEDIGEVDASDASKTMIDEARAAYDALTADQKALVTAEQLKVLTDAEAEYAALTKAAADQAAADAVIGKIEDIGEVDESEECLTKILAARAAYNTLTDDQKALIPAETLKLLTDAEDLRVVPEPFLAVKVSGKRAGSKFVSYIDTLKFEAVAENVTDLQWIVEGADYTVNNDGSITIRHASEDYSVTLSALALDGAEVQSETLNMTVKINAIDRLLMFLQYLLDMILSVLSF